MTSKKLQIICWVMPMMKNTNVVGVAFVKYVDVAGEGKRRPVIIINGLNKQGVRIAFKITSKYANKSIAIRNKYFEILDWRGCGLKKKSWIDLNTALNAEKLPDFKKLVY